MSFRIDDSIRTAMLRAPTRDLVLNEAIREVVYAVSDDLVVTGKTMVLLERLLKTTVEIVNTMDRRLNEAQPSREAWNQVAQTLGAESSNPKDVMAKADEIACFKVALKGFLGIEK